MSTISDTVPSFPFRRPNPLAPARELARLRAQDPVSRVLSAAGEPAWLVTRYDDARVVLADRRFGLPAPGVEAGGGGPNDSLFQDPPAHTRLRRLVSSAFTPRRVGQLRHHTADMAFGLIEEMVAAGPPVDLMEALAFPLPITVIGELLGVPPSDRERFRAWSKALMSLPFADGTDPGAGWENLYQQINGLIIHKRRHPGDDLLSALIAVHDDDGDRLSEAELAMMAATLIPAGSVTTSTAAGVGIVLLSDHGQLRPLGQDPALVPSAVEEVLRYQAAAGDAARAVTQDVELGGRMLRAGDKVLVSLTSANRDQERFPEPDRFDISRPDNAHLTFGHGIHHCLGAALARLELQAVLAALATRLPGLHLAIPAAELPWRSSALFGDEMLDALPVSW